MSYIFDILKNTDKTFILPKHSMHDCVYEELKLIVRCHKDTEQHMNVLRNLYIEQNLPHHLGAPETNLLYRRHHDETIIRIMHMWWDMIAKYSNRDQASFMYVMWKNHIKPDFIPNLRIDKKNFSLVELHSKINNDYSLLQIKKYERLIDEYEVISFDIFDTLLVRPYVLASDLFEHLEQKEHNPGFAKARIQAEMDARLDSKYDGYITLDMIYKHIDGKYQSLQEKEKKFELQVCQPHPVIKQLYDYALKHKKKVIAICDTYQPQQFIRKLLDLKGYYKFDSIFTSCESHASKKDGQLYRIALQKLKCSPSQLLHIGSDVVLDGEKPSMLDIKPLVIEKIGEHLFKVSVNSLKIGNFSF